MKNLEIKCVYPEKISALKAIKNIGAKYKGILVQKDVYFKLSSGRLKLRSINNKRHELIFYHRAETKSARYSNYKIVRVSPHKQILKILTRVLGRLVTIEKKRELYIYQNVKIHLDSVKSLGNFLEFEVACRTVLDERQAAGKMRFLKKEFGIKKKDMIAVSYSDILLRKNNKGG